MPYFDSAADRLIPSSAESNDYSFYREGEGFLDYVRERTAQAKYPAAMLAELYAAGEITREQYERLRRERA